jgi:hypothetical protein
MISANLDKLQVFSVNSFSKALNKKQEKAQKSGHGVVAPVKQLNKEIPKCQRLLRTIMVPGI